MDLFPQHSWHPAVIHLPLAALALAVVLDAWSAWTATSRWTETATLLWWVGLLGAAAGVTSGLVAYNRVEHSTLAHSAMILHRNVALGTVAILLVTAVWRWRRGVGRGPALLGLLGVAGLVVTGQLGGELVFRHALGVPTEVVEQVMSERGAHSHQPHEHPPAPGDSTGAADDHPHAP